MYRIPVETIRRDSCLGVVVAVGLLAGMARGAENAPTLIDDFESETLDGWRPVVLGSVRASVSAQDGTLRTTTPNDVPVGELAVSALVLEESERRPRRFANGAVRIKMRANTNGTDVHLLLRANMDVFSGYSFHASTVQGFGISRLGPDESRGFTRLQGLPLEDYPVRAGETWVLQAEVSGSELSLKVWREEDCEPTSPQLTLTDAQFETGAVALFANVHVGFPEAVRLDASFDEVSFSRVDPGPVLLDDFNDDDLTDWSQWRHVGPAPITMEASEGAASFTSTTVPGGSVAIGALTFLPSKTNPRRYANGFVRAVIRGGERTDAHLLLRAIPEQIRGYSFHGSTVQGFGITKLGPEEPANFVRMEALDPEEYPFLPGEEWNIEAGAVGNRLSLKVWRVGDCEPEEPQLTRIDDRYVEGAVALWANVHIPTTVDARLDATFDHIEFLPQTPVHFIRGDCDDDGVIGGVVSDALAVLNYKFLGGETPNCRAACNPNGDDDVDVADAVYLLTYNFLGGSPPIAPFPSCGSGPLLTDVLLGCDGVSSCP